MVEATRKSKVMAAKEVDELAEASDARKGDETEAAMKGNEGSGSSSSGKSV